MRTVKFLLAMMACSNLAMAQEDSTPEIRVTGEATLTIEPDHAEIDLGVVDQAPTAQAAAEANAKKVDAVITAIRNLLGADADIETVNYAIRPNYHRPRGAEEATIASYTTTNTVRVSDVPLTETGKLIDTATAAGANNVERLHFDVDDAETPRLRALADAAKQARTKAEALADALGLEIVRVISVVEGSPTIVQPYAARGAMMQAEAAPTTPVEPGGVQVSANVTLRVLVSPR